MASDLDRISQALRSLAAVPFPPGFLQEVELAMVNAHLDTTKAARARRLLAERGREEAARLMNCSESQVYRLANRPQTIPTMTAEKETAR